eukprot:scaffold12953_cov123-Skeletonema_dohrnii-CCMP3373.AAC.10
MSSKSRKERGQAAAADCDDDANSVSSSKPEGDKQQPRNIRWNDVSSTNTTNEPSSASATDSSVVTRHPPTSQAGLPTFAAAATAAAPTVPPVKKKKPRRAGFREQFLQQLRVMLDRESQNDNTIVQWSTDGSSFVIMDQQEFEEHIIPTYFDNPIVFSSFLSKLSRWGFRRVPSRRTDCYEFSLPTFRRLGANSAPAAAAAAADTSSNAGEAESIQDSQQQMQVLPLFQQVTAQINQMPAADPQSNLSHAIADLISTVQRQRSSQQPSVASQQPVLNRNVDANSYLQSFQQWQHPNPTTNTLNTTLSNLIGRQTSSAQQLTGYFSPSFQHFAINALMSLSGTLPSTNTMPAMSQPNNIAVLRPLVMVMQRVVEEELQRRNRVDAIQNAILLTMGRVIGGLPNNNSIQSQQGMIPPSRQSLGSNNDCTAQPQQVGAPPPSVANLNIQADSIAAILQAARSGAPSPSSGSIQADSIAAILQAARRGEPARQPEEDAHARDDLGNNDNGDDDNEEDSEADGQLSPRKRKTPYNDDDQYDDSDDDSWENRLRPRKKSRK